MSNVRTVGRIEGAFTLVGTLAVVIAALAALAMVSLGYWIVGKDPPEL